MDFGSEVPNVPDYHYAEYQFAAQDPTLESQERTLAITALVSACKEHNLGPYYTFLHQQLKKFPYESLLYEVMAKVNAEEIARLELRMREAAGEEETDLDVVATSTELAQYYAKIVDRKNAETAYRHVLDLKQLTTGPRIDVHLALARLNLFFNDYPAALKDLDEAKSCIDKGGDWERRNRYKTYKGIYLVATRQFAEASQLLIDSLATFTSLELCSYEQVALYAIISGIVSLDRVDLKEKIIDSPEVLAIGLLAKLLEPVLNLTNSLYTCLYSSLLSHLISTHDKLIIHNKYLYRHANYFLREVRCKAYSQLLESYKLLLLKLMAHNFNVSQEFLDTDLCMFISNKRLNCTIDKVNGIIETNRPDNKNNQYHTLIKLGDSLLTKLQKYGAAVKLSGAERAV